MARYALCDCDCRTAGSCELCRQGFQYSSGSTSTAGSLPQGVPNTEATLAGGGMKTAPNALAALLIKIGPSIIFVHSLSGPYADVLVGMKPKLVRAVVNVEAAQYIVPTDAQIAGYSGIPVLEVFGDHLDAHAITGVARMRARQAVVARINGRPNGKATLVTLPSVGIRGSRAR